MLNFRSNKYAIAVDTSVLMDPRTKSILGYGFFPQGLVVPAFVIDELKMHIEKGDPLRRKRAKKGLLLAKRPEISIDKSATSAEPVDDELLEYCTKNNLNLFTLDKPLQERADELGITTYNTNQLALLLNDRLNSRDQLSIIITGKGKSPSQGIGYTRKGSLVIVDEAADSIGKTLQVVVRDIKQTDSGTLIFARKR